MKKQFKSKLIKLMPIVLLFVLSMCLLSCQGTGTQSATNNPEKLAAPQVILNGNTAQWVANANADKFEISVNGVLSYLENNVTSKILADGETFKIRAIGDGTKYSNSDWSNEVTYSNSFDSTPTYYTVTWKNGDDVLEVDENVLEGTMPEYNGPEPINPDGVFIGWTPELSAVTSNITYQAEFVIQEPKPKIFTVTFVDYDGSVLKVEKVEFGKDATPPNAPSREGFDFKYWSDTYIGVTDDITITAIYEISSKEPTFVISSVTIDKDTNEVKVAIALANNPGIASAKLVVTYANALSLKAVEYNEEIGGMSMQPQNYNSPVIVNWFNGLENSEGDFVLVTLIFDVTGVPAGEYSISLTYDENDVYDITEENIYFRVIDGKITIL